MTIEERAKAKYPTAYDIDTPSEVRAEKDAYIQGATEQREIDIQKAVEWHCEHCAHKTKCYEDADGYHRLDGFICTQIDSLKQAMKGE